MNKSGIVSEEIGLEISRCRKAARKSQAELSALLGMKPSQLCKIEKGRNLPNATTLSRVEDVLNLAPGRLTNLRNALFGQVADGTIASSGGGCPPPPRAMAPEARLYEIKYTERLPPENRENMLRAIEPVLAEYIRCETALGLTSYTRVNCFGQLYSVSASDAKTLAHVIRTSLGLGTAPVPDLLPLLESQNIRVIFTRHLTAEEHSKSFLDNTYQNLVICLYENATPERQLCDLAMEIAYACLYLRGNHTPLADTNENKDFARVFARELLMPHHGIRALMECLAIGREDWNLDLIRSLKMRFGVSAQLFLYQLRNNNLIADKLFEAIMGELNTHYGAIEKKYGLNTPDYVRNIEPEPRRAALPRDSWLSALRLRAKPHG